MENSGVGSSSSTELRKKTFHTGSNKEELLSQQRIGVLVSGAAAGKNCGGFTIKRKGSGCKSCQDIKKEKGGGRQDELRAQYHVGWPSSMEST